MKKVTIAIAIGLLLTGCSSSPSAEIQAKLIEYQECLSHVRMLQEKGIDIAIQDRTVAFNKEVSRFQVGLDDCKKYRP